MATRSRIAIEDQDGTVRSIYCHWDGYPEYNGVVLQESYQTREKVEQLIALGSISSLKPLANPPEGATHTFNNPLEDVTVAFCRDRGEELSIKSHKNVKEFSESDIEEYGYVFTAAEGWLLIDGYPENREIVLLESALSHNKIE